jgi:hypothetical protein
VGLNGIERDRIYEDMAKAPNEWDREQMDHNLFRRYDKDITADSKFDPKSVMIYPIPKEWTTDRTGYGFDVDEISESDTHLIKKFIVLNFFEVWLKQV